MKIHNQNQGLKGIEKPPRSKPEKQLSKLQKTSPHSGRIQGVQQKNESIAAKLTALFMDKKLDVPPSQTQALEAELIRLGVTFSEIDSDSALRALLLYRHSIPLTAELITNTWKTESNVFERLESLREAVRSLVADKRLTGTMRTSVRALAESIDSLFRSELSAETLRYTLDTIIETWAYNIETKLTLAAEAETGVVSEILSSHAGEFQIALEQLLHPMTEDVSAHKAGRFIEVFREAVSELRLHIQSLDMRNADTPAIIKEALAVLEQRLTVLAGDFVAFLGIDASRGISAGLFAEFISESMRNLDKRLFSGFTDFVSDERDSSFGSLRTVLQRSGMAFEWRLLAWYRSGKSMARLQALMQEDLKGILMNFLSSATKQHRKRSIPSKITQLEQDAETLVETITQRQLANILNDHTQKRGVYLEIPFGNKTGEGYARIGARGTKKNGTNTLDTGNLTLTFSIETSRLGLVEATMTVSGKAVTLDFALENEKISTLAREMGDEIRDALNARGFAVGSVTFGVKRDHDDQSIKTGYRSEKVDFLG